MSRKKSLIIFIIFIALVLSIAYMLFVFDNGYYLKREIVRKGIDYFSQKYDIPRKDIKVKLDQIKEEYGFLDYNSDSYLVIDCKGKQVSIKYLFYDDDKAFTDDYQYGDIYNDLNKYLNQHFSFADNIEIDNDFRSDVLRTPAKYDGNIVNYMGNVVRGDIDVNTNNYRIGYGTTWITIWLKADNKSDAIKLNNMYVKNIINVLNELKVNYTINISKEKEFKFQSEDDSFIHYRVFDDSAIIENYVHDIHGQVGRNNLINYISK